MVEILFSKPEEESMHIQQTQYSPKLAKGRIDIIDSAQRNPDKPGGWASTRVSIRSRKLHTWSRETPHLSTFWEQTAALLERVSSGKKKLSQSQTYLSSRENNRAQKQSCSFEFTLVWDLFLRAQAVQQWNGLSKEMREAVPWRSPKWDKVWAGTTSCCQELCSDGEAGQDILQESLKAHRFVIPIHKNPLQTFLHILRHFPSARFSVLAKRSLFSHLFYLE